MTIPSTGLAAESLTPKAALARSFTQELTAEAFAQAVFDQVPLSMLQNAVDKVAGELGLFKVVCGESNPYSIVFSGGEAEANIVLASNGKIAGLNFARITPYHADVQSAVSQLAGLPGKVAYLVQKGGTTIAEKNADES